MNGNGTFARLGHRLGLGVGLSLALASGLTLGPASAHADTTTQGFRQGKDWFLAGDVGAGMIASSTDQDDSYSENGWFLHVRFGGKLNPRVALSAEFWSDGHEYDDFQGASSTQNTLALAATYWMVPKLWVTGGLGSATIKYFQDGQVQAQSDGIALMAGLGYEVLSRERYSVDLTARAISSSFQIDWWTVSRTALAVGAGVSWH